MSNADERELASLNDAAELERLNAQSQPVESSSDDEELARLNAEVQPDGDFVDKIPGLSWVNENIFEPVSGKLGEIAGAAYNLNETGIKKQALSEMLKEGLISKEEAARVEPGLGRKLQVGADMFLQNAFDSLRVQEGDPKERPEPNADILAYSQASNMAGKSLAYISAASMAKGAAYLWDDNNAGKLERWGTYLTMPGQAVARAATVSLAGIGALDRSQALELLSQTQLSMSDLVDNYWIPEGAVGKIGRGLVGFASDVVFDPVNYLAAIPGAAMRAGMQNGVIRMGNRIITNPAQLAKVERQALMAAGEVFTVIKKNGNLTKAQADDAIDIVKNSLETKGGSAIDNMVLDKLSQLDPAMYKEVEQIIRNRQQSKGFFRSIADGDVSVGIGFRMPFSRTVVESEVPLFGQGTRWTAQAALGVKDWSFDSAARVAGATVSMADNMAPNATKFIRNRVEDGMKIGDKIANEFDQFKTFTTRPLWDWSSNKYANKKYGIQSWVAREISESAAEVGNDPEDAKLMVQWLNQSPTLSDEDMIREALDYDPTNLGYRGRTGGNILEDAPTGAPRESKTPGGEVDWRDYRADNSPEGKEWALKQYEESGYLEAQSRFTSGGGASPKTTSPGGPGRLPLINRGKVDLEKMPKYRKKQLLAESDFLTPITRGSPGKEFNRISDSVDSGGFGTTVEYTPIKPTADTLKELRAKQDLRSARELADQTMAQLELRNPKAAKRVKQIRQQFAERIIEMKKRDLPFNILNPFDETVPVNERAFGYFPHILNPEYLEAGKDSAYEAARDAFSESLMKMGLVDKTQAGRADRRSTWTIIDSIRKASGIDAPLFVTDPITASYQRMQDMDNLIAQHDLFKEVFPLAKVTTDSPELLGIIGDGTKARDPVTSKLATAILTEKPGRGWVELDFRKYANAKFTTGGKPSTLETKLTNDLTEKGFLEFSTFLPKEYKLASSKGATIYFPEDVATRIDYLLQQPKSGTARSALNAFNYLFRNTALFGTGYQGMNAMSNMTTYMTARGSLGRLGSAVSFMMDSANNSALVRNKTYTFGKGPQQITLNGEQLYDLAANNGILSNSMVSEADLIHDIWDNIATTKSTRDRLLYKAKDRFDNYSLFRLNRTVAEQNDNMFRLGLFMDSLDQGYSIAGARERVETYFYDFRDVPKYQRVASQVIPFSSFAMKTAESVVNRAKKFDLTPITLPYYVNKIMQGAYVDSYEDRVFLDDNVPFYAQDQIWGPAVPGGKHVRIEAPFVIGALKSFFNPQDSLHPLVGALAMAGVAASAGENPQDKDFEAVQMKSPSFQSEADKYFAKIIYGLIPPSVRFPLTMAQMTNPDEVRSLPLDFIKKYKTGTMAQAMASKELLLSKNAHDFGKYLREEVSPDWLYNALMFGSFSRPELTDRELRDRDIMYGNLVKSQFRNVTLGLARMDNMDRMIMSRMAATQRTLQKIGMQKKKVIYGANVLIDPNSKLKLERKQDGLDDYRSLVAEEADIKGRLMAIKSFYYYYLSQKKSGGTVLDQMANVISPKEVPLTALEAAKLNMVRSKIPDLEFGRRSEAIKEGFIDRSRSNFNSGLMGEE